MVYKTSFISVRATQKNLILKKSYMLPMFVLNPGLRQSSCLNLSIFSEVAGITSIHQTQHNVQNSSYSTINIKIT